MKALIVLIAVVSGVSQAAPAPLLVKRVTNGSVAPAYQYSTTCKVFDKEIIIENIVGGKIATASRQAFNIGGDVRALITAAAAGTVTKEAPIFGGGITEYTANSGRGVVQLKTEGGEPLNNDAEEAATLINLADLLCKVGL